MLTKTLAKIDKYYLILAVVIVGLIILIIFTLKSIFTALNTASEFDPQVDLGFAKLEKAKLDEVSDKVINKKVPSLSKTP